MTVTWILGGWGAVLTITTLVMKQRERRQWEAARDIFGQRMHKYYQRAEVTSCVALGTCHYPEGCGDACPLSEGAEQLRIETPAGEAGAS